MGWTYFDGLDLIASFFAREEADGNTTLSLSPHAYAATNEISYRDGDTYSVRVTDSNGTVLMDVLGTAHYTHEDDCFDGCEIANVAVEP